VLVLLTMAVVGWIRLLPLSPGIADERLRSELTYMGDDGREHVYLGDLDSYLWLRHARTFLRTGTPCDAVVNGECRDTYTSAPVGARTIYARSLHVAAIAGLHRVIGWFRPAHPLPASAFLVPVVVGVLGVLPAFFIARTLAGPTAGVFAGVLASVHPFVLARTIGSDNDVWNVVLPLYLLWTAMRALAAATALRGALWAGLAGIAAGLQAWAWRGWLFFFVVLMAGLAGAALAHAVRFGLGHRTPRVWLAPDLPRIALVLVVFYAVAGVATILAGTEESYFAIPGRAVEALVRAVAGDAPGAASDWPSALTRVAELAPLALPGIVRATGGPAVFITSLVGLVLMFMPAGRWRWWHRAVFGGGALVYLTCVLGGMQPGRATALALLGAPLGAALIAGWWTDEEPPVARRAAAFVVAIWFLAAVVTAHEALRLVLLLVPPLGIAIAVVAGRLDSWIRSLIGVMPRGYRAVGIVLLAGVLLLALLHPLRSGHAAARRYTPTIHDAWWGALTHLRETAHPEAIVHTWWDYGHWVTYVAERRVSNDGASLLTHVPHWIGRALVAPSETQSVGVLRMLACGSDATPRPEGLQGGYGKLRAGGRDPVEAYAILSDLLTLDDAAAAADLARRGFAPPERDGILRSTHCDPGEGYLVLTSALVSRRQSWMSFGLWDPRPGPRLTPGEPVPFVRHWLPCRAARDGGEMTCEIHAALGRETQLVHIFTYRPASPRDARLHVRERRETALSAPAATEGTPALVLLAGAEHVRQVGFASPTYPDLAVLIDLLGERILVGAPPFLQSTFVHLMYLDGRYAKHYVKHDDRTARGERVVTWKIDWGRP
jgi:dolichyl-diphosphooligosaccharide--protein glycosyltransferase